MCKLCNRDRPSIRKCVNSNHIGLIIEEYIGEMPCRGALNHLCKVLKISKNKDIDFHILQYLYRKHRPFNAKELGKSKKKHMGHTIRKIVHMRFGVKVTKILNTGKLRFAAVLCSRSLGTFDTMQEAIQAKVDYFTMSGNEVALKRLQNKIKKYNEENI